MQNKHDSNNNTNVSHLDLANAIRFLSVDAIENAKSGHPGAPMGLADIATVIWQDFLSHCPSDPAWINRDRFILSNGHASMLLYSLLYLSGYPITIENIKNFRQLHSPTAGHPEFSYIPGIEMTTGPLGQGLATAVGMAIAEKALAKDFNDKEHKVIDHYTYVIAGDGCLMEGISYETCSLAGVLKLNKLILIYDDNNISIDGKVNAWFNEDIAMRFRSYNWNVINSIDGHDPKAIKEAIKKAKLSDKPTIIITKTVIGYGSGKDLEGSHKVHGSPLGIENIEKAREQLGWNYKSFDIPSRIKEKWNLTDKGNNLKNQWNQLWQSYYSKHPTKAKELQRRINAILPVDLSKKIIDQAKLWQQEINEKDQSLATRKASFKTLSFIAPMCTELIGGSADLSPSNLTQWSGSVDINETLINNTYAHDEDHNTLYGNYIHYGVREFGMSCIMNGLSLHGGFIPFGGTFLVFIDYAKSALRSAALMKTKAIYILTHDSIGVGEDGPTHQPIEHIAMIRSIPNVLDWRPCDIVETTIAWDEAIKYQGPSTLCLSRQNITAQKRNMNSIENIRKGAYTLYETNEGDANPDIIIIATGSEVSLAMDIAKELINLKVRVVSMPSHAKFLAQDPSYREEILPKSVKKIAIEMAHSISWHRFVGDNGIIISIDTFGKSAPAEDLFDYFGFTTKKIIDKIQDWIN